MSNPLIIGQHEDSGRQIMRLGYDPYRETNMKFAQEMLRVLLDRYPGYGWSVSADKEQGICWVQLPALMGATFKFVIKLNEVMSANDFDRKLCQAGGEILERFRLSRRGLFMPEYSDVRRNSVPARFMKAMPE